MPTDAEAMAPVSPSPIAWTPLAVIRDPSNAHSPRAKLIAPDAL
jgi:hypothetical protein